MALKLITHLHASHIPVIYILLIVEYQPVVTIDYVYVYGYSNKLLQKHNNPKWSLQYIKHLAIG